jgi:hypothetical protein
MTLTHCQKDMTYIGVEIYFQQENDRPDEATGQVGNSDISGTQLDQDASLSTVHVEYMD